MGFFLLNVCLEKTPLGRRKKNEKILLKVFHLISKTMQNGKKKEKENLEIDGVLRTAVVTKVNKTSEPVYDSDCGIALKVMQPAPVLLFGIAIYSKGRIVDPDVWRILRPHELKLLPDVYSDFPTDVMAIIERRSKPYNGKMRELFKLTLKNSNEEIIGQKIIS